nr:tetratricopeptide repeat protein [Armatimonadota bacterium]
MTPRITLRTVQSVMLAIALAILVLLLLRGLLSPDPGASFYLKAKNLEDHGLLQLALRHYALISDKHPESSYAPIALERQGDIWAGLGRSKGNTEELRRAVLAYRRLAEQYPTNLLAGKALLAAGEIAANDLRDSATAKRAYEDVLQNFPNNATYTSEATLRLGRLAIQERDGKTAQALLQRVLQRYSAFPETAAEAQYHLGIAYETLFKDKQHLEWARNAYDATIKRYPQSVWATNAQERLGMMTYLAMQRQRPARRVLIQIAPLPDKGFSSGSGTLLGALRLLLAARGLEVSEAILRGWSLAPFYTGFVSSAPSRVVQAPFENFPNIVANIGLNYTIKRGGNAASALRDLQDELDLARPPVIYDGRWLLAIGYDSDRNEVLLQGHGAQYEEVAVKELTTRWKKPSPLGGSFALVTFHAPKDRPRASTRPTPLTIGQPAPRATPTPTPLAPFAAPGASTALPPLTTPTYVFELPPLSVNTAHRNTIRHAVTLLRQPRDKKTLLNLEALKTLARELGRVAVRPPEIAAPVSPVPVPEGEDGSPGISPTPTAAPANITVATIALPRARALLGFFRDPLQRWLNA